ncbi:MAG: hypothetical protein LAO31_20230 [Acidobacteriia bacterium]|nr:hypothetical protein [Terriglobia bacterium]
MTMNCSTVQGRCQRFPDRGRLSKNTNLSFLELKRQLKGVNEGLIYSYVVTTVERDDHGTLCQKGSAPNFHGGIITLCTCKWRMRSWRSPECWSGVWIAGICSKDTAQNSLFYLMKVSEAYRSHFELWNDLSPRIRKAKAAHKHRHGDLFKPKHNHLSDKDETNPKMYVPPCSDHMHAGEEGWHDDIRYVGKSETSAALLVGDPVYSFLWRRPKVQLIHPKGKSFTQGSRKWDLDEFVNSLSKGIA